MNNKKRYCLFDLQRLVKRDLDYSEFLQLIVFMCKNYELIEVSEYVKKNNLNDKTVRNRIKSGKIPTIDVSETTFIIQKLII